MHNWFPAYDRSYYRYSLGVLLTLDMLEHVAPIGVAYVDFGCGDESYKDTLTTKAGFCLEGSFALKPRFLSQVADLMMRVPILSPKRLGSMRLSLKRRLMVIEACETEIKGQLSAVRSLILRLFNRLRRQKSLA